MFENITKIIPRDKPRRNLLYKPRATKTTESFEDNTHCDFSRNVRFKNPQRFSRITQFNYINSEFEQLI